MQVVSYELGRLLGRGGICCVQDALGSDHRRYAIKRLLPNFARRADYQARLAREFEVLHRITHPNVVSAVQLAFKENELYLVLEHLDADPLDALLEQRGPLPLEDALGLFQQAASGVASAHAAGVLHRDIKPSNLMVMREERPLAKRTVKLIDFGTAIAPADDALGSRLTGPAAVIGTAEYMPLECLTCSSEPDARADVFALGVTLYEMLTGRVPREGTFGKIIQQWLLSSPPALLELRPDVPSPIARVVERAIDRAPEERYADATDLMMAVTDALRAAGSLQLR